MDDPLNDVRLTDTQLGILAALCRPLSGGDHSATPATDQEIAEEVLLSVDAVEGYLRTLYGKFGIEDLPNDQERARLAEMTIEGGYLAPEESAAPAEPPAAERTAAPAQVAAGSGEPAPRPTGVPLESVEIRPRPSRPPAKGKSGHSVGEYVTVVVLILVVVGGALAISGIFNSQPSTAPPAPTPAAFRAEVSGDCKLALEDAPSTAGKDRAGRARGYLDVIEAVRGKFESLVQPTLPDIALERFSTGLTKAVKYTADVANGPPPAGSQAEAENVTELTSAAKQVKAGAVGYGFGHECVALGDLIARSAQNAAAP
ncbi:MAG TPA: hypothetical protein VH268_09025 [Solirubrobacterales bacterium]|jgi:hypothetical protein|nr:hypothetical protein [Solirubrobacterales bacterium]